MDRIDTVGVTVTSNLKKILQLIGEGEIIGFDPNYGKQGGCFFSSRLGNVEVSNSIFDLLAQAKFIKPLHEEINQDGIQIPQSQNWIISTAGLIWLEKWHKES